MKFTVTYRGKNGAMVTEAAEAASRAECIAAMKARGIVPVGVKEGVKPGRDRRDGRVKMGLGLGPIVACVASVALVAVGVLWWLGRDGARPSQDDGPSRKKTSLAKVVKPAPAPKPIEVPVAAVTNGAPNSKTNGWVLRRGPHGKMALLPPGPDQTVHHPSTLDGYWPKAIFLTTPENKLGGLLRMKPGGRIIANQFLPGEEEAWLRAMRTPIKYEDTDTPEDRQLREDVQALKEEILKQVESGKSIKEVMEAEYERLNEQAAYREKMAQTLYLLKKEGTPEEVEEFLKTVNPTLREQGMMPLSGSKAPPKGRKAEYFRQKAEKEAAKAEAAKE